MPNLKYALLDESFPSYRSHHIRVKVADSHWEKQGYFQLRKKIFHTEQNILPENETDAQDFRAIAIVAMASTWSVSDKVVGAVRIYQDTSDPSKPNTWFGGRLCVAREYRGHKSIGKALINEAVSRAIDLGCENFLANIQPQNESYFQSVHWRSLDKIEVADRPHIRMQAILEAYPFMARDPA